MQDVPARMSEWPSYLTYILMNPAFNPKIAFLLYASIGLFLLLLMLVGIVLLMRLGEGEEVHREEGPADGAESGRSDDGEALEGLDVEGGSEAGPRGVPPRRSKAPPPTTHPRTRPAIAAVAAFILVFIWGIAGYTTSDSALCKDCHWLASEHAKAAVGTDPHSDVACVSCHESGDILGRYVTDVPARLTHFAEAQLSAPLGEEYGRVTSAACSSCHQSSLLGVTENKRRGLKVSHKEPLAAAAACIDCHALRGGVVAVHNAGMRPCLRCHDAKRASSRCDTCHDEKASATRARTTSFARPQIVELSCGGCHDEAKECDWCHGMRLPHSTEFKAYAHARAGAVDFWYSGGKTCSRCHNASRRSCQRCHGKLLGQGHSTEPWLARGHRTAAAQSCDTCHRQFAFTATRDFCNDLCHTPAARDASPR